MKRTLTNAQAYEALTAARVHWDRKSDSEIIVWVEGYLHQDCHNIESYLRQAGMRVVKQEFDKICGKTYTIFKHKAA